MKKQTIRITLLLSLIYLLLGNAVGFLMIMDIIDTDNVLIYLFYPYAIQWVAFLLVGFNSSVIIFQLFVFWLATIALFPIGLLITLQTRK